MTNFVVTSADRELFTTCRRAWDYGAGVRRGLAPNGGIGTDRVVGALRHALAVHYFPGMWAWNREIVAPLVSKGLDDELIGVDATALALVRQTLDEYRGWASELDTFTPLRVETDFDVTVPDPASPTSDLATPDGRPIHFSGRIDLLVVANDEEERRWLVEHRIRAGRDDFASPEVLGLDERAISCFWGWEQLQLAATVAGTVFNEILLPPEPGEGPARFRRTVVAWARHELESFGRRLAALATEMASPLLSIYPSPTEVHCRRCLFRRPCGGENRGDDVEALLAAEYSRRVEEVDVPARIGAVGWSLGRGAAPLSFQQRRP